MAFLEKLENSGIPVKAAVTASAPADVFAALNGFLNFPRKNDAVWVNSLFILSSFAFENYYGVPGLARSLFNPEYYDIARKAYLREPYKAEDVPTDLKALIRKDYFDPQFFAESAYGKLVAQAQAYRWVVQDANPKLLWRSRRSDHCRDWPLTHGLSAGHRGGKS